MEKLHSMSGDIHIPSPTRVESPKTQMVSVIPTIPFIPPPPFMPPMPPPPFMHGDMPPLRRFVASPPLNRGYSPAGNLYDRERFSPDSRYRDDYSVITPYDTETDFSPPRSPIRTKSFKRDRPNGGLS